MKLNKNKLRRQLKAVQIWKSNRGKGTIEAATGFGKSFIAMILIRKLLKKRPFAKILIVVPSEFLKRQWIKNLDAAGYNLVEVTIINTLITRHKENYDFLILDEIHRYGAEKFRLVFNLISYNYILGLTATYQRYDNMHSIINEYCPIIDKISLKECLKNSWVSDLRIYNFGITMSPEEKLEYETINDKFNYYFSFFAHDFSKAIACIKDQKARDAFIKDNPGLKNQDIMIKAINFSKTLQKRKSFYLTPQSKLDVIKTILEKFHDLKIITFSEYTTTADTITKLFPYRSFSYHSKKSSKRLKEDMRKFIRGEYTVINTSKALDEGIDIPQIEMAIIHSGNATKRQAIQRMGRAIRFEKGKIALIINLYLKDTRDEYALSERLQDIPNTYWIQDIEDIEYYPNEKRAIPYNYGIPFKLNLS